MNDAVEPVLAELARLRSSLDEAFHLYREYRDSAAARALRITKLLGELENRDRELRRLRAKVEQAQRARDAARDDFSRLRQRRGVKLALRAAGAVKRLRKIRVR